MTLWNCSGVTMLKPGKLMVRVQIRTFASIMISESKASWKHIIISNGRRKNTINNKSRVKMSNKLLHISPIDGRYTGKTEPLQNYFSEFALIKYRVIVEIKYFIAISRIPETPLPILHEKQVLGLLQLIDHFDVEDAAKIKSIERATNHDVKAVEYWIKEQFAGTELESWQEFIHFGLTSQDINNTAIPLMIKEALENVILPDYEKILFLLDEKIERWEDVPMLARTHGQPASPTRLGKELQVFRYRLQNQLNHLQNIPVSGKFGGATGNFNAHKVAFPDIDWIRFAENFLENDL